MASINRFRGSPRATVNDLIRWIVSSSNVNPDPDTDVGPTVTIPTPAGAVAGDLVVVVCYYRGATQNYSVSTTGGQSWVPCATHRSTSQMVQAFYCRFNGTWAANPVFTVGSGTETAIGVMHVFRGQLGAASRWAMDQSPALGSGAGTGFTITGVTTKAQRTLSIALVASQDDNTYTLTTPGLWMRLGNAQYRSTGGTDAAITFAQLALNQAGPTGNLTQTQATLGADAGITAVLVFKEGEDFITGRQQISRAPSRKAPGRRMFIASPRSAESPPPAGGTVTGNLAATETADTFAATGDVIVQGTLAATETADTFAATGDVVVQGTLAATEGADTFAATGSVSTGGTMAATEGTADTFAATGTVLVEGTLAANESADTFAATGTVLVEGDLAATESADTASFIGGSVVTGTLAATESADTAAFAGQVIVTGTMAANEAGDTFAATGTVLIQGTMAATESPDVFAATGTAGGVGGVPSGGSGSWRRRRRMSR